MCVRVRVCVCVSVLADKASANKNVYFNCKVNEMFACNRNYEWLIMAGYLHNCRLISDSLLWISMSGRVSALRVLNFN